MIEPSGSESRPQPSQRLRRHARRACPRRRRPRPQGRGVAAPAPRRSPRRTGRRRRRRRARWCDRAAKASWSSRLTSCSPVLQPSVSAPMAWSVKASHSPSWAMWSSRVTSPYLKPVAGAGQQVRRLGHRLHPAGDHDVALPGPDQLVGQRHRGQPGQAHLVDRHGRDRHGDARLRPRPAERGSGRHRPAAPDPSPRSRPARRESPARSSAAAIATPPRSVADQSLQASQQLADRRPRAAHDDRTHDVSSRAVQPVWHSCWHVVGAARACSGSTMSGSPCPTWKPPSPSTPRCWVWCWCTGRRTSSRAWPRPCSRRPGHLTGEPRCSCSRRWARTPPLSRFLDRAGPGLQQLAYRVRDVEEASAVLRRRGLRLLYDAARVGTRGSLINFVHPKDTGGVLIELVEPRSGA